MICSTRPPVAEATTGVPQAMASVTVLPKASAFAVCRKTFGFDDREALEIFVDDDRIVLAKYEPTDIFSGQKDDLIDFCGKKVSRASIRQMARLAGLID